MGFVGSGLFHPLESFITSIKPLCWYDTISPSRYHGCMYVCRRIVGRIRFLKGLTVVI